LNWHQDEIKDRSKATVCTALWNVRNLKLLHHLAMVRQALDRKKKAFVFERITFRLEGF